MDRSETGWRERISRHGRNIRGGPEPNGAARHGSSTTYGGSSRQTRAVRGSWGLPDDRAAPELVDDRVGHVAVISPAGRTDISESVPQTLFHCKPQFMATWGWQLNFWGSTSLWWPVHTFSPSGCVSSAGGCGCEWNSCFGRRFWSAACGPTTSGISHPGREHLIFVFAGKDEP
jgi:hypothetical protein